MCEGTETVESNLEAIRYQARELTQLEAVTMAMDSAMDRGLAGDPQAFVDGLPWGWAVVNTNAVGQLAGTLMDALAGGLDGPDRERSDDDDEPDPCPDCGGTHGTHQAGCAIFDQLRVVRTGYGTARIVP